jgi:hypothetical protein
MIRHCDTRMTPSDIINVVVTHYQCTHYALTSKYQNHYQCSRCEYQEWGPLGVAEDRLERARGGPGDLR